MGFFDWLTKPLGGAFLYPIDSYANPIVGNGAPPAAFALSKEIVETVGATVALEAASRIANGAGVPVAIPEANGQAARLVRPRPRGSMPFAVAWKRPVALPARIRGPMPGNVKPLLQRGPMSDEQIALMRSQERQVGDRIDGDIDVAYKAAAGYGVGEPIKYLMPAGAMTAAHAACMATMRIVRYAAAEGRSFTPEQVGQVFNFMQVCHHFG